MTRCTCTDLERGVENCRCKKPKELKAMAKKKPKKLYVNMVNLGGLYSLKPVELTYDTDTKCWWDRTGNFDSKGPGTKTEPGHYIKFTSKSRLEVERWTAGAAAVMAILAHWAKVV